MGLWGGVEVDGSGVLRIAGLDARSLARSYGTPLVVLDEEQVRRNLERYRTSLAATGLPGWEVAYAGKAFLSLAFSQLLAQEDVSLDVVSGGELYIALAAGFPAARIIFHGNNKSAAELREAVKAGVGRIAVDNFDELDRLRAVAREAGCRVRVLLRVVPGVEAHTHAYIQTGTEDTKFGFDITSGQAAAAVRKVLDRDELELRGFHCHIGSQILDLEPYRLMVARMTAFMAEVVRQTGFTAPELDLGGGLGIRYTPEDGPPPIEAYVDLLSRELRRRCSDHSLPLPRLIVEPGRSVVGEAGTTLYTVGSVKRVEGLHTYVAVDGGMTDNPRPALYGAQYHAVLIPSGGAPPDQRPVEACRLVGKCCESGDVLVRDCRLPAPEEDDLVAVLSTGAYTYSMASHYNRMLRPAVVLVREGRARLIIKREQYRDLLRGEQALDAPPVVLSRKAVRAIRDGDERQAPPAR